LVGDRRSFGISEEDHMLMCFVGRLVTALPEVGSAEAHPSGVVDSGSVSVAVVDSAAAGRQLAISVVGLTITLETARLRQ